MRPVVPTATWQALRVAGAGRQGGGRQSWYEASAEGPPGRLRPRLQAPLRAHPAHLRSCFSSSSTGSPPMKVPQARPGGGSAAAASETASAPCSAISRVGASTSTCTSSSRRWRGWGCCRRPAHSCSCPVAAHNSLREAHAGLRCRRRRQRRCGRATVGPQAPTWGAPFARSTRSTAATAKTRVLPVPALAWTMPSAPRRASGSAASWTGEGRRKPASRSAAWMCGGSSRASQLFRLPLASRLRCMPAAAAASSPPVLSSAFPNVTMASGVRGRHCGKPEAAFCAQTRGLHCVAQHGTGRGPPSAAPPRGIVVSSLLEVVAAPPARQDQAVAPRVVAMALPSVEEVELQHVLDHKRWVPPGPAPGSRAPS